MRVTSKCISRPQPTVEGSVQGASRRGKSGARAAGWTTLLAAALLGAGAAYADECSDEWDDSTAAQYCSGADSTVTVANVPGTNKCSVDLACYTYVDLLNGPSVERVEVSFFVMNPTAWEVWTNDEGNSNSNTNGIARSSVDDITICYYAHENTGNTWVNWQEKFVIGSCGSREVEVTDAMADGLDMRVSELR